MTSIKGYTDLLREEAAGPVNEGQLEFFNVIRNNVERMLAFISDLVDINRLESGRLVLELNQLSLSDMMNKITVKVAPAL